MKKTSLIIFGIFLISLISAFPICVDKTPPSPPSNLILTKVSGGVQLTWSAATDVPSCSEIAYYDIYRGFNSGNLSLIANSAIISFLDSGSFPDGTYTYIVHAWDLAGHNEGNGTLNSITISSSGGNGGGGGGGGISDYSYWECGEWSNCVDGIQTRTCADTGRIQSERTETKECVPEFTPLGGENQGEEGTGQKGLLGSILTGAVVGVIGFVTSWMGLIIIGVVILGVVVFIILRKRKFGKRADKEA